ncbi:MAG: MBL fold metallo-hydrolase, partial [Cytophagales bacterium]|nr:MBL fold metallo-hydrolase [Cytophagales bacterium]
MSCPKCYLKSNVVIEPLFERWYAWAHLISPATAALNVTGRHLKIMNSYIQAPEIHAEAVKNPRMLGGPFMDFAGNKVGEVRKLREETVKNQEAQIRFSEAIKALNELLQSSAIGYSLEQMYELIPDELRGYVELVYDLNNNPAFRLYEQLLYKSPFYNPGSQSIAVWLTDNDERPFVLSTPRLDSENVLHLNIPFADEVINELAEMKRRPKCPALI